MNETTNAETNSKPKRNRPRLSTGHLLPFKKEHKTSPSLTHGAHSMRRAYFSNGINRSTRTGIVVTHLERRLAEHRGCKKFTELPITAQLKAQLLIGNLLFLSLWEPAPDNKTGMKDYTAAQNLCNRILTELGMNQAERPERTLADLAAEIAAEEEGTDAEIQG